MSTAASETAVQVKKPLKGKTLLASLPVHLPESWDEQRNINDVTDEHDQYTPLTSALRYSNEGTINALLACNDIDVNQADGKGRTPLVMAYAYSHQFVAPLILKGADLKQLSTSVYSTPEKLLTVLDNIRPSNSDCWGSRTVAGLIQQNRGVGLVCEYVWFATMPEVKKDPKAPKPEAGNPFIEKEITELNTLTLQKMTRRIVNPYPTAILALICDYIPKEQYKAYVANPSVVFEHSFQDWVYKMGEEHFRWRKREHKKARLAQEKLDAQTVVVAVNATVCVDVKLQADVPSMALVPATPQPSLASLSVDVATLKSTVATQAQQILLLTQTLEAQQKLLTDLSPALNSSSPVLRLSSSAANSNGVQVTPRVQSAVHPLVWVSKS